jgi:hypothetical protein
VIRSLDEPDGHRVTSRVHPPPADVQATWRVYARAKANDQQNSDHQPAIKEAVDDGRNQAEALLAQVLRRVDSALVEGNACGLGHDLRMGGGRTDGGTDHASD